MLAGIALIEPCSRRGRQQLKLALDRSHASLEVGLAAGKGFAVRPIGSSAVLDATGAIGPAAVKALKRVSHAVSSLPARMLSAAMRIFSRTCCFCCSACR